MAVTQPQLDALVAAYGSGILTTKYEGREVTYRSMGDLASAIDAYARALGVDNPLNVGLRNAPRRVYLSYRRAT